MINSIPNQRQYQRRAVLIIAEYKLCDLSTSFLESIDVLAVLQPNIMQCIRML